MILDVQKELEPALALAQLELCKLAGSDVTATCTLGYDDSLVASLTVPGEKWPHTIGAFRLSEMPGDGDLIVSNGVWLSDEYQGKGIGSLLHKLRVDVCHKAGIKGMLCTVSSANDKELTILQNNGWIKLSEYGKWNYITDAKIQLWMLTFPEEGKTS